MNEQQAISALKRTFSPEEGEQGLSLRQDQGVMVVEVHCFTEFPEIFLLFTLDVFVICDTLHKQPSIRHPFPLFIIL